MDTIGQASEENGADELKHQEKGLGKMGRMKQYTGDDRPFSALDRKRGVLAHKMVQRNQRKDENVDSDEGWYSRDVSENSENYNSSEDIIDTAVFVSEPAKDKTDPVWTMSPLPCQCPPQAARRSLLNQPDPHNPLQVQAFISQYLRSNVVREQIGMNMNKYIFFVKKNWLKVCFIFEPVV